MRHSFRSLLLTFLGLAALAALGNALGSVLDWRTFGLLFALLFGAGACAVMVQMAAREKALLQTLQELVAGQQHFGAEVSPVWSRHIASSCEQMETAIGGISERFAGIVDKLAETVQTANLETDSLQNSDKSLLAVISRAEHELGLIVQAQQAAASSMVQMLEKVQGLDRFTQELHGMAQDVAKIAQQSTLLSLNAAIEAARAGELGRGFAVVAQEFRMLANMSGDTGRRIAEKVAIISVAIGESGAAVLESVREREARAQATEATITGVIGDFKDVTGALERSSALLTEHSMAIQSEIGQALVEFQFQDRVTQILNHLKNNVEKWPQFLQAHDDACLQTGDVFAADPQELLTELQKTYVMADQHVIHSGGKVAQKTTTEIDFF